MVPNSTQSRTLLTFFVLLFHPKYIEKAVEETEYLVVYDKSELLLQPEDLLISCDWKDKEFVEHKFYKVCRCDLIAKSKSDPKNENVTDEEKLLIRIANEHAECNDEPLIEYCVITLPISKLLYEKLVHSSWQSDTNFTFDELCNLLTMQPRFFEKESLVMFLMVKNLLSDETLYPQLNRFFEERRSKEENLFLCDQLNWYENIFAVFCENEYFVLEDQFKNIIVTASDYEQKYKIPIHVKSIECLSFAIPVNYLAVDYTFLQNQSSELPIVYNRILGLTVDVDFTNFFAKPENIRTPEESTEQPTQPVDLDGFYQLLSDPFISAKCIQRIVLRVAHIIYDLNFDFLLGQKIHLHCFNCKFDKLTRLPKNLEELNIGQSKINVKLELPEELVSLVIKNTCISSEGSLVINEKCKRVTICETEGDIRFPNVWNLHAIAFSYIFKNVDLERNLDGSLEFLYISNATIIENMELGCSTNVLYLENVKVTDNTTVRIHGSCKKITVMNCEGSFDLTDFATWLKLKVQASSSAFMFVSDTRRSIRKIYIRNIQFDVYDDFRENGSNSEHNILNSDLYCGTDSNLNVKETYIISSPLDLPFLCYVKVISRLSNDYDWWLYQCINNNEQSELVLKNVKINKTISFGKNVIQKVSLAYTQIENGYIFEINAGYNSLSIEYCKGRFIIPGIQIARTGQVYLSNDQGIMQFNKVKDDVYDCKIVENNFNEMLLISHKIRTALLQNLQLCDDIGLEFLNGCKNLCLDNCRGRIVSPQNDFRKLRLCNYSEDFPSHYLSYPVYEIEVSLCNINNEILLLANSIKRVLLYRLRVAFHSSIVVNHECERIIIRNCIGHFGIPLVLKMSTVSTSSLRLRAGVLVFVNDSSNAKRRLSIKNAAIFDETVIQNNIHTVNLISVVVHEDVELRINDDCEVLLIDICNGKIEFSRCTCLQSLTIEDYKFNHCKDVFNKLLSLSLERVTINASVKLEENIKTVKLVDVKMGRSYSMEINENCETVHVHGSTEDLRIPHMFNCIEKKFIDKPITIYYAKVLGQFGRTIFLKDLCLRDNYEIPNDVECVILRNVDIKEGTKLMLNSVCKYLNIEVQKGCIDVSKVEKLAKVVFFDCLPVCKGNLWRFSAKHKDCTDTSQKKRLELPNCIEDIVFEHVSVPKDTLLVVNEGCRNVAIIFSKGSFDLSNAKQLRKFKLLITKQSSISIELTDLTNVASLEISYYGNERYFMFLLLNCINAKEVILYNTVCELHDWIGRDTSTIPEKEMAPWELNELRAMINQESCTSGCRSPNVWFEDFNARCNPIFCWEKRKNIQNLSIIAFQINDKCLEHLRMFVSLKTLSIMAQNVQKDIFYCLPFSLVNFSLMPIQCSADFECNVIMNRKPETDKESLKCRHLKNLKFDYLFFIEIAWSMFLPEKVDVLEIMPSAEFANCNLLIPKKIKVRKLVIMQVNREIWVKICKTWEIEEYYSQLLYSLSQYIDFCSVKEIKILDQDVEIPVDPRDYN